MGFNYEQNQIFPFSFLQSLKESNNHFTREKGVKVYCFDLLLLNDQGLINRSQMERKQLLESLELSSEAFEVLKYQKLSLAQNGLKEEIKRLFDESKARDNEGLMLKDIRELSTYRIGERKNWYKLKYFSESLKDSLDLVLMGGYFGKGKCKHVLRSFLVGTVSTSGEVIPVSKVGTGFNDQFLQEMTEKKEYFKEKPKEFLVMNLKPDVFFDGRTVWEIGYDSFTHSPSYKTGKNLLNLEFGLSLRFPRFIRTREDKGLKEVNTEEEITEIYV